jgi:hypothetical protein
MSRSIYVCLALLMFAPLAYGVEKKAASDPGCNVTAAGSKGEVKPLTDEQVAALVTTWANDAKTKEVVFQPKLKVTGKSFQLTATMTQRKPKFVRIKSGDACLYVLDAENKMVSQAKISLAKLVPC